jgi:arylsulfatase A-like enzyme
MPTRDSIRKRLKEAGFSERTAYCTWLDDAVGSLLDKVESLGLKEDTLVIFSTDHGIWRHGKATCYDGGMRVPLVMYWPGTIRPGRRFDGLTQNIDLTPTILELCGATLAPGMNMDGRSLAAIVRGSDSPVHDALFCELGYSRAVKTRDWKYIAIRYPREVREKIAQGQKFNGWEGRKENRPYLVANSHLGFHAARLNPHYFEADQLYDLRNDPREETNVIEQHPQQAQEMKALLTSYLKRFNNRPFGELVPE